LARLKVPTPLDRGDISGDLTDISSTNGALRAVKATEKGGESHVDLTKQCSKPLSLQRTQFFMTFGSPESTYAAGSR